MQHSRRDFIKYAATTGGGLILGFNILAPKRFHSAVITADAEGALSFNAFFVYQYRRNGDHFFTQSRSRAGHKNVFSNDGCRRIGHGLEIGKS